MKRRICLLFLFTGIIFILHNPQNVLAFSDTRGHWASPQIDHLSSRDIISGYPDGFFHPDAYISRAEFATILVNVMNKQKEAVQLQKGESSFTDVSNDYWAKGYIEAAQELSYAHGDGRGSFDPASYISREEAVTMLVNSQKLSLTDTVYELNFVDEKNISFWARNAAGYAVKKGLVTGYPDGYFRPQQALTRAEVAVLFEQFLDLQGQKFHFYGTLVDINLSLRQGVVKIDGSKEVFEFSDNLLVYREGSVEPVTELSLPLKGYFDVNRSGKLVYWFIPKEVSQGEVNLNFARLTGSTSLMPTDSGVVKLGIEEKEAPLTDEPVVPSFSLEITKQAMKVDKFVDKTGATGRGQLVAVIDSGVDPGHPDLQKTSDGYIKIVDFVDLTDEGKVELNGSVKADNGFIIVNSTKVDVSRIDNEAEAFIYGFWDKSALPASIADVLPDNKFLVVAAASEYFNIYDTIYVDTNMDGQINDEIPLMKYSKNHQIASIFGEGNRKLNFIISELFSEERYVKFGFDCVGHGTEVAGIVAANGEITGVAPGAQILPIKVLNRLGMAYLDKLENAIHLAAEMGANIAVLSVGQYKISIEEQQALTKLASKMWNTHGMIICIAAGNNGPGIGTVASSAAIKNVLSVGAYATPRMWWNDYRWEIDKPTLWYFSSSGPGIDGLAAPVLVAPGNAVSTYPLWGDSIYRLDEGTSMAAPHVAGAAALLMDVVTHRLYIKDSMVVCQGLIAGAEKLPGYEAVEQGYGAVNLLRAWDEIKHIKDEFVAYKATQYSPGYGYGNGFYSREIEPANIQVKIKNNSGTNKHLAVGGLSSWMKPEQYSLQVPAGGERTFNLKYDELEEPGLYSDFLVADDYNTPGWDVSILQTIIVPYDLYEMEKQTFEKKDVLGAGQFKRYFFTIPEGCEELTLTLDVGEKGRARMHVISPQGFQEVSQYAGVGESRTDPLIKVVYQNPARGTWEVVVYSSATLSAYKLKNSQYTLKASLKGAETSDAEPPERRYLVSVNPPEFVPGEKSTITLHFWNPYTKMPAEGVVSINDRLYEIVNGQVKLDIIPEDTTPTFNIAY